MMEQPTFFLRDDGFNMHLFPWGIREPTLIFGSNKSFNTEFAGNVGIGVISAFTYALNVNGTVANTSGSWSVLSDARIKNVDSAFTDGLNVIEKINPIRFHYKSDAPFDSKDPQIGVIAQELEKVAPYMVNTSNYLGDTAKNKAPIQDLKSVDNQAYVFLLINAVKEQQVEIQNLQKQIEELKSAQK